MSSIPLHITQVEEKMAKIGIKTLVVINKRGRVIDSFGESRLNLSKERKEVLFMQTALQCSMQDEQNDEFGKMQFFMAKRDKSKFFCRHIDDDKIAIAVANSQANASSVIYYINQLSKMYDTASKSEILRI
ncbi:MAG TPA: hypothetical protein VNL34_02690 [Candidatus Nitrosotenuis sp.]|nr:hypothetical protein [Candidatus Nitrosotenuis sp.]